MTPSATPATLKMHPNDMHFCVKTIRALSQYSRATRARVGCVIWHVPSRRIITMGYNGTPAGEDNTMEHLNITLDHVIHAEMNALNKLSWWEKFWFLNECILVVTHTPCAQCTAAILHTKIHTIYFLDSYGNHSETLRMFQQHNRTFIRVLET